MRSTGPARVLVALFLLSSASVPAADTITGRVVDVNGIGLAGIDLDATSLGSGGNPHLENDGTDASGNFTATIDPGVYRLTFYAPPPPTTTLLAGVLDNVVVSGTRNLGTIVLLPGVSLSGRTLDTAGLPLSGVKVVVHRDDSGASVPMKSNTTSAFGTFAVAVPATALTVELDPSAVPLRTLVPRRLALAPSGATSLGDLTLVDGFVLSGTVTNSAGLPLAGVDLDVLDSATGVKLYTPGDRTAATGAFALRVPAGTYDVELCPTLASRLVAREFAELPVFAHLNAGALALAPGVLLSGRVWDVNGTPLAGVDLDVGLSASGASLLTCNDNTSATGDYAVIVPSDTLDVSFAYPGRHGTSAADLHAGLVVSGDTLQDGVLPAPTAQLGGTPLAGSAPLLVQFTDLSTGAVTAWSWDFGDGSGSTLASPSHTYGADGSYTVSLTVSGPGGPHTHTEASYVSVGSAPPVAEFTGAPTGGVAPLVVSFTNQSSGVLSTHAWDFGDGTSSDLASPDHTFSTPGSFTVTLTETGPGGTSSRTRTDYVVVLHPAPVAAFAADVRRGLGWLPVRFTDLSSGPVTLWSWDFGDGSTSGVADPFHLYRQPGVYTVTLSVTGPGGTSSVTKAGHVVVRGGASSGAPTGSVGTRLP